MTIQFEVRIAEALQVLRTRLVDYDSRIDEVVEKIAQYKDELRSTYTTLQEKKSQKLRQIYEIINSN